MTVNIFSHVHMFLHVHSCAYRRTHTKWRSPEGELNIKVKTVISVPDSYAPKLKK